MKVTKKVLVHDQVETEKVLLQGEIIYSSMPYNERVKAYSAVMEGIRTDETADHTDDLKLAERYYNLLKERIEKVDIKVTDGEQITSIDDLYEYSEGISIGNELALQIISSQRLGKQKLN